MDKTLVEMLENRVGVHGDRPLYSFLDRQGEVSSTLSFNTLYEHAHPLAIRLQMLGCNRKPVIVYCPHGVQFIIAFFACVLVGAWPVPVGRYRGQPPDYLATIVAASGADVVISTKNRALASAIQNLKLQPRLVFADQAQEPGNSSDSAWFRPALHGADTAFIQYTSGSLAAPKGVVISHANVMDNLARIARAFRCADSDIGLCWLPFHHDMGLIGHVMQPLYSGIHNYFMAPADFIARPMRWPQAITRYGVTISGGPDFAYALCARQAGTSTCTETANESKRPAAPLNLQTWRLAYCGAEKVRASTLSRFGNRFSRCGFNARSFFPCYGLAESTLFVSGRSGVRVENIAGQPVVSLGKPSSADELLVVDEEKDAENAGKRVRDGACGEICLRSDSVATQYWRQASGKNRSCVNPSGSAFDYAVDGMRGYFRTGDTGCLLRGELYLLGRSKNIIKRRGRTFHAEDMEAALIRYLPPAEVARAAAFTSLADDAERLVVLLERPRQRTRVSASPAATLVQRCRSLLLQHIGIAPDEVFILRAGDMPLTSSGKLRRQQCRLLYQQLRRAPTANEEPETHPAN